MNRIASRATVASLFFLASFVGAQERSISPGSRIRFRIGDDIPPRSARIERLTRDSLLLRSCEGCTRLGYARPEVNHIEARRASASGWRVLGGFGVGGLVGLAGGVVVAASCRGGDKCVTRIVAIPIGGLLGGLIGGVAAYLTSYRWEPLGSL